MRIRLFLILVIVTAHLQAVCQAVSPSFDEILANAQAGDANSQFSIGLMYQLGRNVGQDCNEAARWFLKSANQGNPKAQYELAQMYEKGQSVPQDYNTAMRWYTKAALQNYAKAEYSLGTFYNQGLGIGRDYEQAVTLFTKAANHGNGDAQLELGVMYLKGLGVDQNDTEAEKWLTKAAMHENVKAQYCLGLLYCKDRSDELQHNYSQAIKWFSKAGAQNHVDSQYLLGVMYCRGEGVPQDYKIAVKWFTKAASQGSSKAQLVLGACYWTGKGVTVDYAEALKWMSLATANGDKDAKILKTEMSRKMSDIEIEESQKRFNKIKNLKGFVIKKEQNGSENHSEKIEITATGFFITPDGFLLTACHAVGKSDTVQIKYNKKQYNAKVVRKNESIDAAVLKVDGNDFSYLPLSSAAAQTGDEVFTMGYPQVSLQGNEPKFTEGSISSLSGTGDNPNFFQISVPVQPGNSGGPLINQNGQVIGLVVARLNDISALLTTGAVPQNVNYALKSSYLQTFLQSIPDLSQKIKTDELLSSRSAAIDKAKKSVVLITTYK